VAALCTCVRLTQRRGVRQPPISPLHHPSTRASTTAACVHAVSQPTSASLLGIELTLDVAVERSPDDSNRQHVSLVWAV
jgi:hypothetical protein